MGHYERFLELLAKKKSGNISLAEQHELMKLMTQDPLLQKLSDTFENIYTTPLFQNNIAGKLWPSIEKKINSADTQKPGNNKKFNTRRLFISLSIAASLLLCFFGYQYYSQSDPYFKKENIISTKRGSRSNLVLPDGTKVTLNADSKISYSDDLGKSGRELSLCGEAFFDVKHDASKPFIIHTEKADIKVLGTAFNVRNYAKEDLLETSLIRGRIEITINDQFRNRFILKPSDKLIISKSGISKNGINIKNNTNENVIQLTNIHAKDSTIEELSWMDNKAIFVNKTLEEISRELERQFNINVIFRNEAVKKYRYTIYTENYNLNEIMQVLYLSREIHYTITNKELIIE